MPSNACWPSAARWFRNSPTSPPTSDGPSMLWRPRMPRILRQLFVAAIASVALTAPARAQNPKTSGNARYTYLAAYAFAKHKYGSEAAADDFIKKLFGNVPVFDTGGRAATTTFVERQTGDVLVTFEAETNGIRDIAGADKYQ